MTLKKIPIGEQEFKELIGKNKLYIDKTKQILDLIDEKYAFLARPRRWGKSLMLSTIKELFLGNKELFKGTYAYENYKDWDKSYPVIYFGLVGFVPANNTNNLEDFLNDTTEIFIDNKIYKIYDFIDKNNFKLPLLIEKIYNKTGKQVVVLFDEYDTPYTANMDNELGFNKVKNFFQNFYGAIKNKSNYIKFFILSGLTKIGQTALFSGLNNFPNITFSPLFHDIVGYTEKEIKLYFKDYISLACEKYNISEAELLRKIKEYYDGYYFGKDEDRLYNSWSINYFFSIGEFDFIPYWGDTGKLTLLECFSKNLKSDEYLIFLEDLRNNRLSLGKFDSVSSVLDIDSAKSTTLSNVLFQSGYLTYKDKKIVTPNKEAKIELIKFLLTKGTEENNKDTDGVKMKKIKAIAEQVERGIKELKPELLEFGLNEIQKFKDLPTDWSKNNPEGIMKTILILYLELCDFEFIVKEGGHYGGKTDIEVYYKNRYYIIETKVDENDNKAIQQIEQQYQGSFEGKEAYKVGITWHRKRADKKIIVQMDNIY